MIPRSLFILGRQPALGRAELESLYGGEMLQVLRENCIASSLSVSDIMFSRLGGVIKLATYLGSVQASAWKEVEAYLANLLLENVEDLPEGKLHIGLSIYGTQLTPKQLLAASIELKKSLRAHGYSVRFVPNRETALSSAQVAHNNLTAERGIELLVIRSGSRVIVGRTVAVQDISGYAQRDQARPKRDSFVGMLPPKLAQVIVNLATSNLSPSTGHIVLDPFCGTGVVLQEALLMGYGASGSDIEPRMVDYARENLSWLTTQGQVGAPNVELGDATTFHWKRSFSVIATEAYLGRPLSSWPSDDKIDSIIHTCNTIIEHFLQNIAGQIAASTRFCIAVPSWFRPGTPEVKHLPILDRLDDLGYNRVSFQYAAEAELIYYRPGQLVGRELLVLTKK